MPPPEQYSRGVLPAAPGVLAWLTPNGGWGESNAALISGHNASMLVDTLWDVRRTAEMLAQFSPAIDAAPIQQVVNTHSDGDHWFGNQLLENCEIIATTAAARHMQRDGARDGKMLRTAARLCRAFSLAPLPGRRDWRVTADYFDGILRPFDFSQIRATLPTATFSGQVQLEIGGRPVQLVEVGPAHTSGDLVVYLPEDRIIIAGDVLFAGVTPVLWDGSVRNWIRACERMLEWKADLVLPGHGPLTDLSAVETMRQYWVFLRAAVVRHFEKGHSPPRAALSIFRTDDFQKQSFARWACPERMVINVYGIYRRLLKRRHRLGPFERFQVLRKTAILTGEFNTTS